MGGHEMGKRMRWVVGGLLFLILAVLIFILIFPPLGPGDKFAFFVRVLNVSPREVGPLGVTGVADAGKEQITAYPFDKSPLPSGDCGFYYMPAGASDRLLLTDAEGREYPIATYRKWRLREAVVIVITASTETGLQGYVLDEGDQDARPLQQSSRDR